MTQSWCAIRLRIRNTHITWQLFRWTLLLGLVLFIVITIRRDVGVEQTFIGFPLFWTKPTYASSLETFASFWPLAINLVVIFVIALAIVMAIGTVLRWFSIPRSRGIRILANVVWVVLFLPALFVSISWFSLIQSWSAWPEPPPAKSGEQFELEERSELHVFDWKCDIKGSILFPQCRMDLG